MPTAPPPPRELGKPDDDLRVDVRAYAVDATAPPELRDALAGLTARFIGKDRSFEDLVNAAAEVTRFLQRDLGYYLGYAYLPEQDPKDGVIRIAVLEGRLDRVVLNWRDGLPVDRQVVEAYLARLLPGSILRVRDVERVVFLVNDLRGMTTRFEIRSGSTPGTAALHVTPQPEGVWSGKVEADTNGSRFLGQYRIGGLLQMNSPFGRGDGFTANLLASTSGGLGFVLIGYTTPIGSDGIKVGSSLSSVRYQLDREAFPLNLNGTATTLNAYALYPVIRSRNLNLFTLASVEHKVYEDRQEAAGGRTRKSVDTVAIGSTGDFRDSMLGGGVNTYEASIVTGRVTYPDGRPGGLDDAPSFTKIGYGFSRLQDVLTGRLLAYVSLRGQQALRNLDTTEQFRLGGPEGVRAFATGEGTGDSGSILSLELRFLPPEDWFGRIAREMVMSAFVDVGTVRYRRTPRATSNPNQPANTEVFSGAGFGVSWVRPSEYALRFSLSSPISGTPRSDTQKNNLRAYLLFTKFFM
ncbi:MAG: ShlB/FhaC/HecB family hemolysin secretion/activation protein [Rubrivivax sp.]|nr:ShlB/FhaC/HecB family hemolysin secretion/activation protein [Rubrivivax sp.]